ncbi:MAG: hypothetical protein V4850_36960 [Myxococcota bacterium]
MLVSLLLLQGCDWLSPDEPTPPAEPAPLANRGAVGVTTLAPPDQLFGRTPAEKFAAGVRESGAFSVYDGQRCDRAPLDAALAAVTAQSQGTALAIIPAAQPVFPVGDQVWTAEALNARVVEALGRVYRLLSLANDPDAATRHVCVAPYLTAGDGGGVATSSGYIFYDASSLGALLRLDGGNVVSLDALAAHEFGHQVQYWLGDRFRGEVTVRRTELVADCLAGAFLTMGSTDLGEAAATYAGVGAAVKSWADTAWRNPQHHGSPIERETASALGVSYALEDRSRQGGLFHATAQELLTACEDAVAKNDAAQVLQSPAYLFGVEAGR